MSKTAYEKLKIDTSSINYLHNLKPSKAKIGIREIIIKIILLI